MGVCLTSGSLGGWWPGFYGVRAGQLKDYIHYVCFEVCSGGAHCCSLVVHLTVRGTVEIC